MGDSRRQHEQASEGESAGGERLDQALVTRGLVRSRSQAADLVRRGFVAVDGQAAQKPALMVAPDAVITLGATAPLYVGRGAEKLVAGLAHFGYEARDRVALDIGASTGGFTEILLAAGARHVYAVDVGHDQLHASLRDDPRVTVLEGTDARRLDVALVPEAAGAIVTDVSFISLTKALPAALALAAPGAWLIALVKPQFEVGRAGVGKGGMVRDAGLQRQAVEMISAWLSGDMGWTIDGVIDSPIAGGDGNREFLLGARR